jgi:NAD(P)-dependent dehydrogenase (short-subunit alcohol dehydrogenase family)
MEQGGTGSLRPGRVAGKIALVTGAGRGIGRGIADCLAREGATIVVAERDQESGQKAAAEISAAGGEALFLASDMSDVEDTRRVCREVEERFGRIDILVNNAGGSLGQSLFEIEESTFRKEIDVNVIGLYYLTEAVAKTMMSRRYGKIVNIASIVGEGYPTLSPGYAASKGAAIALTYYLAGRLSEYDINVNAVCPGSVRSGAHWEEIQTNKARREGLDLDQKVQQIARQNPFSRVNTSADIANAVLFLCSDEAESITGQILDVDGGRRSLSGWMVLRTLQQQNG